MSIKIGIGKILIPTSGLTGSIDFNSIISETGIALITEDGLSFIIHE